MSPLLAEREPVKTIDVVRDPQAGVGLETNDTNVNATCKAEDFKNIQQTEESSRSAKGNLGAELSVCSDDSRLTVDHKFRASDRKDLPNCNSARGSPTNADASKYSVIENAQAKVKFKGRGITCINFAPGPNAGKVATAYSSTVFRCPSVDVPRTAYVWDISKK